MRDAVNAHYTNTVAQMAHALTHGYNSLEGDVRIVDGVVRMAHDPGVSTGLTFDDWATIGAASQRMLRIDVKEPRALSHILRTVRRLGIPDERLSFNVTAGVPLWSRSVSFETLRALRAAHPGAHVGLNIVWYGESGIRLVEQAARAAGAPVMVAIDAPRLTRSLVERLRSGMLVGVWNDPTRWNPADIEAETHRMRALGVDGMIDLRRLDGPFPRPVRSDGRPPGH